MSLEKSSYFITYKTFSCKIDAEVLLCDFHREKSWQEWTSKIDNGVFQNKQEILNLLRNIAHAATSEQCQKSMNALTESIFWKENLKMRNWFGGKWLPNIKVVN